MFEAELIEQIASLPEADYLSIYQGRPSIFSGQAPEEIDFPYIVFDIVERNPEDNIITRFEILMNIFDYSTSETTIRKIAFSISNALDNITIQCERFSDIRLRRGTRYKVNVPDPRGIQYYLTFDARGSREYWAKTI